MKIHSVVDVITNSSTVIFTVIKEDAVDNAYKSLQAILDATGVNKKAEDIFEIKIEIDESYLDDWKSDWEYEKDDEEWKGKSFEDYVEYTQEDSDYGDHKSIVIYDKSTNTKLNLGFVDSYFWGSFRNG